MVGQPTVGNCIQQVSAMIITDTYFYNNIRYFYNFKPSISTAIAGDSRAEIYKYSNINLAIKVGK